MPRTFKVRIGDRWHRVEVGDMDGNPIRVLVDGAPVEVVIKGHRRTDGGGSLKDAGLAGEDSAIIEIEGPQATARPVTVARVLRSPMPGAILSVAVSKGDRVAVGDELCVLEAMKMQQSLRSDWEGTVRTVYVVPGQQVLDGDPIMGIA